jgi:hypothetical protein
MISWSFSARTYEVAMVDRVQRATDVAPEVLHLGKLLDKLEEGRIRIPRFQRPFQWQREQMRDLLDSIRRRFPIGSILVWETDRPVKSQEKIGPIVLGKPQEGPISYTLDGQQRLTTLLGTLRLPKDRQSDDHGIWRIFFDLHNNAFLHLRPDENPQVYHLPVRALLGTFDFIEECRRIAEDAVDQERARNLVATAEQVADVFRNYQLPVIRITYADLNAAVKIFARLNTRGRRMTQDQMVSALTYSEEKGKEFNLAREIDRILISLSDFGFGNVDRVAILRAILAAAEKDMYDTDWTNIVEDGKSHVDLREPVSICEQSLRVAVEFLKDEGVASDRLLPYSMQIVLLSEFFRLCPEPSEEALEELRRWFWVTSFTGWFATFNSASAKLALDEMRALARGDRTRIESVRHDEALPFPSRFDGRSARVRAFLLYLMSLGPLSLDKGERLDAGGLLSQLGPQALRYVLSRGLPSALHPSPANRILLGASHRGQARAALLSLPEAASEEILKSHGIPPDSVDLLRQGNSEEFIRRRLEFLIEGERGYMERHQVTPPHSRDTAEPELDVEDEGD